MSRFVPLSHLFRCPIFTRRLELSHCPSIAAFCLATPSCPRISVFVSLSRFFPLSNFSLLFHYLSRCSIRPTVPLSHCDPCSSHGPTIPFSPTVPLRPTVPLSQRPIFVPLSHFYPLVPFCPTIPFLSHRPVTRALSYTACIHSLFP